MRSCSPWHLLPWAHALPAMHCLLPWIISSDPNFTIDTLSFSGLTSRLTIGCGIFHPFMAKFGSGQKRNSNYICLRAHAPGGAVACTVPMAPYAAGRSVWDWTAEINREKPHTDLHGTVWNCNMSETLKVYIPFKPLENGGPFLSPIPGLSTWTMGQIF